MSRDDRRRAPTDAERWSAWPEPVPEPVGEPSEPWARGDWMPDDIPPWWGHGRSPFDQDRE